MKHESKPRTHAHDYHDYAEIRSEKTRKMLGEIPPTLVRCGIAVIALTFAVLAAAVCLLPYPYSDGESILRHIITTLL